MAIFANIDDYGSANPEDQEWIHLLVGDWQMIADLAFADLVLWYPTEDQSYLAIAHVRPSTTATVFYTDFVGERIRREMRGLVDQAFDAIDVQRASEDHWTTDSAMRVEAIPVTRNGRPIAVITMHMDLGSSRMPSRLELVYRQCAQDLLRMISRGLWPDFATPTGARRGAPRVGDGLVRLNAEGIVEYASPNAVSAYRRLGGVDRLEGRSLAEVTAASMKDRRLVDESLPLVVTGKMPWRTEVESGGVILSLRAIPLRDHDRRYGALVLVRDVSELRRRDLELMSKDATIREIHHRVKNNLQTVAALLRLQSRRMNSEEGKQGLQEAMRRVSAIALVHETLSQGLTQNVVFDELIDRQFRLAAEVATPDRKITTERSGTFGSLSSELATPLSLVIIELVANAVEHGLATEGGTVWLDAQRSLEDGTQFVTVQVSDNGAGLGGVQPNPGLGLQIVRTLVTSDLRGTITWSDREPNGTTVTLKFPVRSVGK